MRQAPASRPPGPLRIALAVADADPDGRPVARHCLALARALQAGGADVVVWLVDDGTGDAAPGAAPGAVAPYAAVPYAAVPVRRLAVPRRGRESRSDHAARIADAVARLADEPEWQLDLVHAHDAVCAVGASSGRRPVVRTVHRLAEPAVPRALLERGLQVPAGHVCTVRTVARRLADGWDIAPVVIAPGVEFERYARAASDQPSAVAARADWRRRLGRFVLLASPGSGEPPDVAERRRVIAVLRGLERRTEGLRIVVGGRDVQPAPDAEPSLVAAADVVVIGAQRDDPGTAAWEALAAGVPVVAGAHPLLADPAGGVVRAAPSPADLEDRIVTALRRTDPTRQERGRTLAASRPWSVAAQAHVRLYRAALARSR